MIDGTLYWWPFLALLVIGFIILGKIDPFNKN
jgi:hypothetical protein